MSVFVLTAHMKIKHPAVAATLSSATSSFPNIMTIHHSLSSSRLFPSQVYSGLNLHTGQLIAIKEVQLPVPQAKYKQMTMAKHGIGQCIPEIGLMQCLEHPNIVQVCKLAVS